MPDFSDANAIPGVPHWRLFDTVGDGSGTTNLIGDYSSISYIVPGIRSERNFKVNRLRLTIGDNLAGWRANWYSSQIGPLSRWLGLHVTNASATELKKVLTAQLLPAAQKYWISDSGYKREFYPFAAKAITTFTFDLWMYDENGKVVPVHVGPDYYGGSILTAFLNNNFTALFLHRIAAEIEFEAGRRNF